MPKSLINLISTKQEYQLFRNSVPFLIKLLSQQSASFKYAADCSIHITKVGCFKESKPFVW